MWEYFLGNFNFDVTPLGPIGCPVIIHSKLNIHNTWDFRSRTEFNIVPTLNHYRCFHIFDGATKSLLFSDTIKFLHEYLTQPTHTQGDRILNSLNFFSCAVKDAPTSIHHEYLTDISKLRNLFNNWIPKAYMKPHTPSPAPPTIKFPAPPAPTAKRVAPTSSIHDGTCCKSINIATTTEALQHALVYF